MRAADERARVIAGRAEGWRKEGLISAGTEAAIVAQMTTGWRSYGLLVRAVFFFFATTALSMFYGFWMILNAGRFAGVVTAIAGIAAAEFLIRQRWFWTGVEEALWLGGALALIVLLPSGGSSGLLVVLAVIFAAAGARLRNPLFVVAAALFALAWFETRFDLGTLFGLVVATVAMVLLTRAQERPSTQWMLDGLVIVMPVAAIFTIDSEWVVVSRVLFGVFGIAALLLALKRPHHPFFLAAIAGFALPVGHAIDALPLAREGQLAVAGALLLALAFVVTRLLRDRTTGLTLAPAELTPFDDEMKIVGSMVAADESAPPAEPQPVSGGGGFGGAGASGEY